MSAVRLALCGDGRSPHTRRWATAMQERGFDVTVVWRRDQFVDADITAYAAGVEHAVAGAPIQPRGPWLELRELRRAQALGRRLRPDIVHGLYLQYHGWTAQDMRIRPLVLSALGSDVLLAGKGEHESRRGRLVDRYQRLRTRRALHAADLLLADSSEVLARLAQAAPSKRTELIRFGAEPPAGSDEGWRARLDLPGDAFVVLSTRLLKPNYNIDAIIRAMPAVLEAVPPTVLILKDYEPFSDPEYRRRCLGLVQQLGLTHAVRIVGELDEHALLALYAAADLYVTVPSNDALAVSVFEAMAARVPVVASRAVGLDPEVLRDRETVLLVNPGDPTSLASAIVELAQDADLRARLGESGFATYERYGRATDQFDRASDLYHELLR